MRRTRLQSVEDSIPHCFLTMFDIFLTEMPQPRSCSHFLNPSEVLSKATMTNRPLLAVSAYWLSRAKLYGHLSLATTNSSSSAALILLLRSYLTWMISPNTQPYNTLRNINPAFLRQGHLVLYALVNASLSLCLLCLAQHLKQSGQN